MRSNATTPDEYIAELPDDRKEALSAIRKAINDKIDPGFKERMLYGGICWVVPHELYPPGYHCDPKLPLTFMGLGWQKNYISLGAMCLYSEVDELEWFCCEWPNHSSKKLDMGKSCIRFKKLDDVPLDLIGQLASRTSPLQWIEMYERSRLKKGR